MLKILHDSFLLTSVLSLSPKPLLVLIYLLLPLVLCDLHRLGGPGPRRSRQPVCGRTGFASISCVLQVGSYLEKHWRTMINFATRFGGTEADQLYYVMGQTQVRLHRLTLSIQRYKDIVHGPPRRMVLGTAPRRSTAHSTVPLWRLRGRLAWTWSLT